MDILPWYRVQYCCSAWAQLLDGSDVTGSNKSQRIPSISLEALRDSLDIWPRTRRPPSDCAGGRVLVVQPSDGLTNRACVREGMAQCFLISQAPNTSLALHCRVWVIRHLKPAKAAEQPCAATATASWHMPD